MNGSHPNYRPLSPKEKAGSLILSNGAQPRHLMRGWNRVLIPLCEKKILLLHLLHLLRRLLLLTLYRIRVLLLVLLRILLILLLYLLLLLIVNHPTCLSMIPHLTRQERIPLFLNLKMTHLVDLTLTLLRNI